MEEGGHLYVLALYIWGKNPKYPLHRRLGGEGFSEPLWTLSKIISIPYRESNRY
jgi:hypothetical protein